MTNVDVETFSPSGILGDGPVVLACVPSAVTPPCSNKMVVLEDHIAGFEAAAAAVLGGSADRGSR